MKRGHDELSEGTRFPRCQNCGTTHTPQWREGPLGPKTLCNACGVKWYRQTKKCRKGLMGGKPGKAQRRGSPTKQFGVVGDSGDELTTVQLSGTVSDMNEESEERDAAMSLLCFAGVDPDDIETTEADHHAPEQPSAEGLGQLDLTAAATLDMLVAVLPENELLYLLQLQAAADDAYKEAQAAAAATAAVAQVLSEKLEDAEQARSRVKVAEQQLMEEVRDLERQVLPELSLTLTPQHVPPV